MSNYYVVYPKLYLSKKKQRISLLKDWAFSSPGGMRYHKDYFGLLPEGFITP